MTPKLPKFKLPKFWVLDGKTTKPASLHEWARWFQDGNRLVAQSIIGDDVVSTVFTGIDHSLGGPVPLLFETMIFVDGDSKYCEHCATFDQALKQHDVAMTELKQWHKNAKTAPAKA